MTRYRQHKWEPKRGRPTKAELDCIMGIGLRPASSLWRVERECRFCGCRTFVASVAGKQYRLNGGWKMGFVYASFIRCEVEP